MNTQLDEQVFSCSRAQAIADGVLHDASGIAREAGFRYPVALTAGAWSACVAWSPRSDGRGQDESGRLWDVLNAARLAIRKAEGSEVQFSVLAVPKGRASAKPVPVHLVMTVGPGDDIRPVLTIMLPGDD